MSNAECVHGCLARSCYTCELQAGVASLDLSAERSAHEDTRRERDAECRGRERAEAAWRRTAELANKRLARAERAETALSRARELLSRWVEF